MTSNLNLRILKMTGPSQTIKPDVQVGKGAGEIREADQ
tara:strand:- start:952 stop:1065 length:114 start_codon:yes stop_codon:yes gene_type:complete